jgi:hypothetical protein
MALRNARDWLTPLLNAGELRNKAITIVVTRVVEITLLPCCLF